MAALLALVLRQGIRLVLVGVALGLGTAALLARLIASLLFEVPSGDVATLLSAAAALGGMALLAAAVPAIRAARTPITDILRG